MKNFDFLLCFLGLCVLPCVFTDTMTKEEERMKLAKSADITAEELQECLNQVDTDFDSITLLSDATLDNNLPVSQENATKIGCFGACVSKKNGVLVNSKIVPEKLQELAMPVTRNPEAVELVRATSVECTKRVSDKTDDCDIIFSFSRCFIQEMMAAGNSQH